MTDILSQMPVKKQNGSCIKKFGYNGSSMLSACGDIGIERRHPAAVCFDSNAGGSTIRGNIQVYLSYTGFSSV